MSGLRSYFELQEPDRSGLAEQVAAGRARVHERLRGVTRCVAVMSGKGGVGKSFVAALLAAAAARRRARVGLLDADLHGPSAARLSGVRPHPLRLERGAVVPPVSPAGVLVMSMELLLEEGRPLDWVGPEAEGFVWRGAREHGALREFLSDVAWGELDLLLVDLPPGTARLVDLVELVPGLAGVVGVTIPSAPSLAAVRRSLQAARGRGASVLGILENMSGYVCPGCGERTPLFGGRAGAELAETFEVPLLDRVPFDPGTAARLEGGDPVAALEGPAGRTLDAVAGELLTVQPAEAERP